MDKTAIEHWSPVIGGQFWWTGLISVSYTHLRAHETP